MGTKMRSMVIVGAVLFVVLAGILVTAVPGQRSRAEKSSGESVNAGEWEYLVVQGGNVNFSSANLSERKAPDGSFSREAQVLQRNLDKLGSKGWELVTVYGGTPNEPIFYFKRLKETK